MPSIPRIAHSLAFIACLVCTSASTGRVHAQDASTSRDLDFGRILQGTLVEHQFVVKNERNTPLVIDAVRLTPPLTLVKAPTSLEPGAEGVVRVRLDTSRLLGLFEGRVLLSPAAAEDDAIMLSVTGTVYQTVEVLPRPAIFVVTERGQGKEQSVELVSHESAPLEITGVTHPRDRFSTKVETIETGKRFRLTLTLDGTGTGGRSTDPIVVTTSSRSTPVVRILANTFLRERVYTFPDAIDFGSLPLGALEADPALIARLAQTLMVYRKEAGFEVAITSDLDLLDIRATRGPAGDRWQATLTLRRQGLKQGPFKGTIVIATNDPEFPRLTVPVTGALQR